MSAPRYIRVPFMYQTAFCPVFSFCQTMSALPSWLKSPVPTMRQPKSSVVAGKGVSELKVVPFMIQTLFSAVALLCQRMFGGATLFAADAELTAQRADMAR